MPVLGSNYVPGATKADTQENMLRSSQLASQGLQGLTRTLENKRAYDEDVRRYNFEQQRAASMMGIKSAFDSGYGLGYIAENSPELFKNILPGNLTPEQKQAYVDQIKALPESEAQTIAAGLDQVLKDEIIVADQTMQQIEETHGVDNIKAGLGELNKGQEGDIRKAPRGKPQTQTQQAGREPTPTSDLAQQTKIGPYIYSDTSHRKAPGEGLDFRNGPENTFKNFLSAGGGGQETLPDVPTKEEALEEDRQFKEEQIRRALGEEGYKEYKEKERAKQEEEQKTNYQKLEDVMLDPSKLNNKTPPPDASVRGVVPPAPPNVTVPGDAPPEVTARGASTTPPPSATPEAAIEDVAKEAGVETKSIENVLSGEGNAKDKKAFNKAVSTVNTKIRKGRFEAKKEGPATQRRTNYFNLMRRGAEKEFDAQDNPEGAIFDPEDMLREMSYYTGLKLDRDMIRAEIDNIKSLIDTRAGRLELDKKILEAQQKDSENWQDVLLQNMMMKTVETVLSEVNPNLRAGLEEKGKMLNYRIENIVGDKTGPEAEKAIQDEIKNNPEFGSLYESYKTDLANVTGMNVSTVEFALDAKDGFPFPRLRGVTEDFEGNVLSGQGVPATSVPGLYNFIQGMRGFIGQTSEEEEVSDTAKQLMSEY